MWLLDLLLLNLLILHLLLLDWRLVAVDRLLLLPIVGVDGATAIVSGRSKGGAGVGGLVEDGASIEVLGHLSFQWDLTIYIVRICLGLACIEYGLVV